MKTLFICYYVLYKYGQMWTKASVYEVALRCVFVGWSVLIGPGRNFPI